MPFPMKGNSHRQVGRAGNATKRGGGTRAALPPACHFPLFPSHPPSPTLPPCTPTRARPRYTSRPRRQPPPSLHGPIPRCSPTPQAEGAGLALPRCGCRARPAKVWVQGPPCQGVGAGPALPCFPLSISGHLSPRPSTSVRLTPWQIRLVPLCRLFRRPPAGPSGHRPTHAWQIRLVSLCRLVRRASIPSCTASLQARAGPKKRDGQFNASQTLRRAQVPKLKRLAALPTPQASCTVRRDAPRD